jgi:DNA-binding transcriptional MerR regulator
MQPKNGSPGQVRDDKFHIGELARATDVPIKTIRFYEDVGLLPPAPRAANGYRLYEMDDVQRLRFIRKVRSLDISLDDLREIVTLWEQDQIQCSQVEQLLKQKLTEIEQRIKMLQALQDDLQTLLHQAECCPSQDEAQNSACHYAYNL